MNVEYLKQAKHELDNAIEYYELQKAGLGFLFQTEVRRAIRIISQFPQAYAETENGVRRCILHKFPHNILYTILDKCILIIAIGHQHRMPDYWHNRM
ncbi:hypothetical protein SPONL_747 [uncultured Candidatus Thioglobus sp.]|nr:hypothetical protein SPONL_747 [uncultured Candidatus Thioglobus sp.]